MRRPAELPALAGSFSVSDAASLGVPRGRLSRADLVKTYHGVRSRAAPGTTLERCAAYLPRLRTAQFFSHTTAAVLHGMPLPRRDEGQEPVHVSVIRPAQPPRTRGVIGHALQDRPGLQEVLGGYPVTTELETWCQLGGALAVDALVVAGDHLLRPGVEAPRDRWMEMRSASLAVRRSGAPRLASALQLVRPGVRSPMESLLRYVLVAAGLPEPEINVEIFDAQGRRLGEVDLLYRSARLVLEYEGAGHLIEKRQFDKDVRRRERFEDAGWSVLRVTADDLFNHRTELLERVRWRLKRAHSAERHASPA